ncbi:iron complex transport system substrate-binding protein [Micromonospora pisi]|uniref:Iron complex transport system substrate-binding protein n=1 Tax=Micromonospora pisi TaxID=589240 RepID=A0A495JIZ3_9ACTN|nr:ABC transporter substrate-binding protein [Micromonospora pisi]RKR88645.1 iron complex transport system substrate-binding protein [Micromonospora pisi]
MSSHLLTRRGFLQGVGATGVLLGLAACGDSGSTSVDGDGPSGAGQSFRYTDGRGRTVELAARPTRVVAQSSAAAALWDAGFQVAGVYGELGTTDGKLNYQAGNIDVTKVEVVGKTYGEFNLERYAALRPELLVDLSFDDKSLWYVPESSADKVYALAPSIGMKMPGLDLPAIIDNFMTLAGQLGADPDAAPVKAARSEYDAAVNEVRPAITAKPGLRIAAISRDPDKLYIADPNAHPDLKHLASLGATFVTPSRQMKPGEYFEEISWEQVGRYPADMIIFDGREVPGVAETAGKIPTWTNLAAVRADQVFRWRPAAPYSYAATAPIYREVAGWLNKAKPLG